MLECDSLWDCALGRRLGMISSSKPEPPPTLSRLSASALVETIDGPVEIIRLAGKSAPVLTRLSDGKLGFRMMTQIRELDPDAPLLQLTNGDGQRVEVGEDHVFVRADGREVRAAELHPGDRLEVGWTYPRGYEVPDADRVRSRSSWPALERWRRWSAP